MTLKAIYEDGVFKPTAPVNLPEGAWVDLHVQPSQEQKRKVISLLGVWKDALRPGDKGDWVSETVSEIRQESVEKS